MCCSEESLILLETWYALECHLHELVDCDVDLPRAA